MALEQEVQSSEKPVFMGFPEDFFMSLECKWSLKLFFSLAGFPEKI